MADTYFSNFIDMVTYQLQKNLLILLSGLLAISLGCKQSGQKEWITWETYHGDPQATHYSSLTQINKQNVNDLEVAWIWEANDAGSSTTIQCNPIIVKDRMYIITPGLSLVMLQADTGKELWRFDPLSTSGTSRGVTYWQKGDEERIFYSAGDALYCLDAFDGSQIKTFGKNGTIDLHSGLGEQSQHLSVSATTPGIIYKDLIIMGSRVQEGPAQAAPGHIRAFNVYTGELEWVFKTIPSPGDSFANTWNQSKLSEIGGSNSWAGFSLDVESGILFCGTGSASYDHWGGNRSGENLFANCILALDAATGKYIWHYQVVHHDIWDYDIACQPNLVQVKLDEKLIDAVAQPTKMGHLFILDRRTGEPVFPVHEIPVPQSKIPGEATWPTQPFPDKGLRYGVQKFDKDDITDRSPEAHQFVQEITNDFVFGSVFLPPGLEPTITMPQYNGGTDWGGAAYDPLNRMLFVNCSNEAEWISMIPARPKSRISKFEWGQQLFNATCQTCHRYQNPLDTMASIDMLHEILSHQSVDSFSQHLQHGKGAMPAFQQFNTQEVQAIYAFIRNEGQNILLDTNELTTSYAQQIPWVATGHNELKDHEGFPANKPPWGTLSAIDLDKGQVKWQVPLGTYPELEQKGHPPTGTFNMGGPLVTASGIVFIGATMDERFRAYDAKTGDVLWTFQLDAGAYSSPSTFEVNGTQYIVIAAGGGGKPGTKSGNKYYCFNLGKE